MTYPHPDNEDFEIDDPFESASNAEVAPRRYYGQLSIDAWYCALVKGQGKVPFDPQQHERRATALTLAVVPIADQNVSFELKREMIAESREWAGIVKPSLAEAGVTAGLWQEPKEFNLKQCRNIWVQCEFVGTGRKYRTKQGDERESTTFSFIAIYPDMNTCRAAYFKDTGQSPPTSDEYGEEIPGVGPEPSAQAPLANDKDRKTALAFLEVIVKQAGGDADAVAAQIAAMPVINKFYSIDSSEVQKLLAEVEGVPF